MSKVEKDLIELLKKISKDISKRKYLYKELW